MINNHTFKTKSSKNDNSSMPVPLCGQLLKSVKLLQAQVFLSCLEDGERIENNY
jgi:hypothetical protein